VMAACIWWGTNAANNATESVKLGDSPESPLRHLPKGTRELS
jgi:hypothetical protein